jgi:hypothetical protein
MFAFGLHTNDPVGTATGFFGNFENLYNEIIFFLKNTFYNYTCLLF